jgi:hypothetical protein
MRPIISSLPPRFEDEPRVVYQPEIDVTEHGRNPGVARAPLTPGKEFVCKGLTNKAWR